MAETSPFVVGQKVGVTDPHARGGIREDEVAKVYKTGNFVLVGEPGQQWRAYRGSGWRAGGESFDWYGCPTSRGYVRRECRPWTDSLAAQREAKAELDHLQRRWVLAQNAIEKRRRTIPPASFLDKIEAALAGLEASEASAPARPLSFTGEAGG